MQLQTIDFMKVMRTKKILIYTPKQPNAWELLGRFMRTFNTESLHIIQPEQSKDRNPLQSTIPFLSSIQRLGLPIVPRKLHASIFPMQKHSGNPTGAIMKTEPQNQNP